MAPAWSLVGLAYARLGHGTLAVEALRQAATLDPHREEGWLNLTRELMELGRHAEAISAAEKGIAANPNSYVLQLRLGAARDRKSTRLNSSHSQISHAVFCLKKKNT